MIGGGDVDDAPAQRNDSERFRIAERTRGEGSTRRRYCRCRRGSRRLADFHMDDAPALRLESRCRRHHVHHHERRHGAARRWLQQEFRPIHAARHIHSQDEEQVGLLGGAREWNLGREQGC